MSLTLLGWLFTLGVLAHNAEAAVFLPAWSARAGRWHTRVNAIEFRFAIVVLSLLLAALVATASSTGPTSVAAYLFTGYVFAMVAKVVAPHLLASLALRRYMPGTATAVLLNFPLGGLFLYRALSEGYVQWVTFAWVAPITALAIVASIPVLSCSPLAVGSPLSTPEVCFKNATYPCNRADIRHRAGASLDVGCRSCQTLTNQPASSRTPNRRNITVSHDEACSNSCFLRGVTPMSELFVVLTGFLSSIVAWFPCGVGLAAHRYNLGGATVRSTKKWILLSVRPPASFSILGRIAFVAVMLSWVWVIFGALVTPLLVAKVLGVPQTSAFIGYGLYAHFATAAVAFICGPAIWRRLAL